jgi:hypothetical protein
MTVIRYGLSPCRHEPEARPSRSTSSKRGGHAAGKQSSVKKEHLDPQAYANEVAVNKLLRVTESQLQMFMEKCAYKYVEPLLLCLSCSIMFYLLL